jgi:hypothetical protein
VRQEPGAILLRPNPTTTDDVNELAFCEFTPTGDCADCNVTSTERISACPARPATGDAAAEAAGPPAAVIEDLYELAWVAVCT